MLNYLRLLMTPRNSADRRYWYIDVSELKSSRFH